MRVRRLVGIAAFVGVLALAVGGSAAAADSISATCAWAGQSQPCSSTTWYPSAVSVVWQAQPAPDSTTGCNLGINYHYNSDSVTAVSCSATWVGSPTVTLTQQYTINVEVSAPVAAGAPTRPPDHNGWYNHPVPIAFTGSSFSGIASCTSATYSGPATPAASVAGSCTDNAGKTVQATSAAFAYDGTPPALSMSANSGDRIAVINWQMGDIAPAAKFELVRKPGLHGKRPSVVYHGLHTSFRDHRVKNGVRYKYTLKALDAAGNAAAHTIRARPGVRLLAPARDVRLTAPPLLRWTAVRRASYYNVQLYRGKHKVLSTWPGQPSLQLTSTWRFNGHRWRLRPGTYHWFVWPGYGRRSAAHYGHRVGTRTFVIVKAP